LFNRRARCGRGDLEPVRRHLRDGGLVLIEPDRNDDLADAIRHHAEAVDLIIVGGGDGTLHRVLPELLAAQRPVGVLPMGTANDLARTLALPTDLLAACDVILAGQTQRIDVGRINDRPFLNVASLGLAVDVTRRLTRGAKSRWGVLAYVWAAIGALLRGRPFHAEIRCDGETLRVRTWQIAVGNGRSYGGGLTIHEAARIDDGLLDLYSLEVNQGWHILGLIPALWRGSLEPIPTVRTLRGRSIAIRPLGRPRSITADGEIAGQTPATIELLPQALTLFGTVTAHQPKA
jgi:YegS/Rv2252/BmrU family lipid kinase